MHAEIRHRSLMQPWAGTVAIREYTRLAASGRGYGQARVHIERDHPLVTDTALTDIRGLQLTIQQALLGSARYIQVGQPNRTATGWDLQCFEIAYLLKLLKVPVRPQPYRNLPAGVIVRLALTAGLAMSPVPIRAGDFVEAAPYVEEYQFAGQSVDQVMQDMMTATGQEWEITESGTVNWLARQGQYYEIALTEGYDFCILSDFEPEDDPLARVVVTDQRGYTTEPVIAREHATDLTARTMAIRADTVSKGATDQLARSLLNDGRVVRAAGKIGLYPQGGVIVVSLPNVGGGGSPALIWDQGRWDQGTFDVGISASPADASYPTFAAPHWAIRPGDTLRVIAPTAGIRGNQSGLYRVRGITFGDGSLYPTLDLIQTPPWTAETLPVARRVASLGASPPVTLERIMVQQFQRRGTPIDAARIASQLEANQVPVLSELSGSVTATQVPALSALTGAVTAAQVPSGGVVADAAGAPTQAEFNALTAALRTAGVID